MVPNRSGSWCAAALAAVLLAACGDGEKQGALASAQSAVDPGPTAVLEVDRSSGPAPLRVYLEGGHSIAAPGTWVDTCFLDFGDGQTTTNCWGIHTYAQGTWTARFTATDNLGRSSTTTRTIVASGADAGTPDAGQPDAGPPGGPTAVLEVDHPTGTAPLRTYLEGGHSIPAPGTWVATCFLDFGDGQTTTACWGIHTYAQGTWTARFTATDNLGRSSTTTRTIVASGADAGTPDAGQPDAGPPGGPTAVLEVDYPTGIAPLRVYLEGGHSIPAPGTWVDSCFLDFGDGQTTTACWAIHTYPQGTWTVRFTATDNLGRSSTTTRTLVATGTDGGTDAGTDAGTDGGTDGGAVVPAPAGGWQFFGAAQGGPSQILGASADEGGNIWVAGGDDGLYLLAPGATTFRRFTTADGLTGYNDGSAIRNQRVISVAGGPAGTVFVGYAGQPGCELAFDQYNFDPAYRNLWKSGDADRVTLSGSGIQVVHYDISSGPNVVPNEPEGRERVCSVLRIAYHAASKSVWFGGNHGVAWGSSTSNLVIEHTHPAVNGYVFWGGAYHYALLTDGYYGLAPLPNGDVWLGGINRSTLFRWGTLGQNFWNADAEILQRRIDLWPDQVAEDSLPEQRVDDSVSDMAAMPDGTVWASSVARGLAHWTPSGTQYLRITALEPNSKATSLERDPKDGSLWIGFIWGGLARVMPNQTYAYGGKIIGWDLAGAVIPDIQSDNRGGVRRILVSFNGQGISPSALGIFTGQ